MQDKTYQPLLVPLGAAGCVAGDLPCVECEYNLRTLHHEAKCPECGTAAGRSIRGDWLKYSDPRWLTQVAGGLKLVSRMITVPLFALAILSMVGNIVFIAARRPPSSIIMVSLFFLAILVLLAALLGWFIGAWRCTASEPHRLEIAAGQDVRRLICGGAVLALLGVPLELVSWNSRALPGGVIGTQLFVLMAVNLAIAIHVRRIAGRIPSHRDVRAGGRLIVWFIAAIALSGICAYTRMEAACVVGMALCLNTILVIL